jgi:hypothetical protein
MKTTKKIHFRVLDLVYFSENFDFKNSRFFLNKFHCYADISLSFSYDAKSWIGLGNVLISKESDSLRLHVLILSNSFEIKTFPRPAQDFAS